MIFLIFTFSSRSSCPPTIFWSKRDCLIIFVWEMCLVEHFKNHLVAKKVVEFSWVDSTLHNMQLIRSENHILRRVLLSFSLSNDSSLIALLLKQISSAQLVCVPLCTLDWTFCCFEVYLLLSLRCQNLSVEAQDYEEIATILHHTFFHAFFLNFFYDFFYDFFHVFLRNFFSSLQSIYLGWYAWRNEIPHNILSLLSWPRSAFYEDTHCWYDFFSCCDIY